MQKETHVFQTEVKQLLQLMIHALYSNKEIFLRELVSNASDALDKLRFEMVSNDQLSEGESALKIQLEFDEQAKTITLRDNGIGMTRDEVIENIGTIANSGTKKFLEKLTGDQAKDSRLIGQFGVGFYSAFIVADQVTLRTRKAGLAADQGVEWQSSGDGEFTLETIAKPTKGTEIILHLKEGMDEFLSAYRLKNIITTYSDHISFPIEMLEEQAVKQDAVEQDGENKDSDKSKMELVWKQINKATALWTQPKSEISDEDYANFYQTLSHDFEKPLATLHNKVEGTLEYTSLLYIPTKAPFDLYDRDRRYGLKLYVKRVFIMDDAEHLMPNYLRFVRGVIDSNDLPLNVSREILQSNHVVDKIRSASVKRILDHLVKLAKDEDASVYQGFWNTFGQVMKEGIIEDYANRDKLAGLMRFSSTHNQDAKQTVSLADYVGRMKEGQQAIYYLIADSHAAALGSPHLEGLRKKGIEVLLLSDRIDEWLVAHLTEFEGKSLKSINQGDIAELADEAPEVTEEEQQARTSLVEKLQQALGDKVAEVKVTHRLTDSPACVVAQEGAMTPHMMRLMEQMGQTLPKSLPVLEINPNHPLLQKVAILDEQAAIEPWALFLLEQAQLADGDNLAEPAAFIKRVNQLLASV
ncbi:heat shock protein 90 [Thiomicrospira aerophila AL3]|uniref:Chaperone protein HtpG n=1 Tax=Thiomicrospira aerophila AL3 TaxID=717772 RepID=W0DXR4_9GAMM|nr:molecular chaperone HtpG [Thiomicrospira aerophila]AHF01651.1 heat shock protein 90 [Thiomicrospira aerophila AL3]